MTFIWPSLLWLMLLIPVLAGLYIWMSRRRKRVAINYSGLRSLQTASSSRWRRHTPPLLMLLALASMLFAVSRPVTVMTLPTQHASIVLAIDNSGSMRADDVKPSRIEAAKEAAHQFIDDVPATTRVGVVTFSATAATVQVPTVSRSDIHNAIDRIELQKGTAVGSGILISLKTLFPDQKFELRRASLRGERPQPIKPPNPKEDLLGDAPPDEPAPVDPGSVKSMAIILLTDGQTTTGPKPIDAAAKAAERGIRVYTVGFGTLEGSVIGSEGWSMRVRLDETALKEIADKTAADFYQAGTSDELKKVYKALSSKLVFEKKRTEVSSMFAALGALLSFLSALLSMIWFNRIF